MTDPTTPTTEADGIIREGSLTQGGSRIGPKAWRLIVSLSEYDDWMGTVLDVVDEAAAQARADERRRLAGLVARQKVSAIGLAAEGWDAAIAAVLAVFDTEPAP